MESCKQLAIEKANLIDYHLILGPLFLKWPNLKAWLEWTNTYFGTITFLSDAF
jgi:hypothetical protein